MPELDRASAVGIVALGGNSTPTIAVTELSVDDVKCENDGFIIIIYKQISS